MISTNLKQKTETFHIDHKLPTLDSMREDAIIQSKVEQRLQELTDLAKIVTDQKLKPQRSGNVEAMVKNRTKWPHEYVLNI